MPAILLNFISGLLGQSRNIEIASDNLANLRTPGYRKDRLAFQDLIYQASNMGRDRAGRTEPAPVGMGADTRAPEIIHSQAELQSTDRNLDLAISGAGFFQYALSDGTTAYSRYGGLQLDLERRLTNSDGLPLVPEVRMPEGVQEWHVKPDGSIIGQQADGTEVPVEGQLTLARFNNPAGLSRLGPYLFTATARSGPAIEGAPGETGFGEVVQGQLEASNVDYADEMMNLLQAQRTYQVSLRALQALDETLALANNIRR